LGVSEAEVQKAAINLKYFTYNRSCLQAKETVKDASLKVIVFRGKTSCKITIKLLLQRKKSWGKN